MKAALEAEGNGKQADDALRVTDRLEDVADVYTVIAQGAAGERWRSSAADEPELQERGSDNDEA